MAGAPSPTGPLAGLKVIEMAGIGPVPLAGLMLSEMGARVLRIERVAGGPPLIDIPADYDLDRHGRDVVKIDLKQAEGREFLLRLAGEADILIEGYRPGVMERLGAGPDAVEARNPGLVYGRMTGFGQNGPLASRAGHDLTYLAYSGVLHAIGRAGENPVPPLNLVGDYGGGTMFLLCGILAALVERGRTGQGRVVDAAMVDGASMLAAPFFGFLASGFWRDERGANLLDTGCPFYDTYETADAGHVAVACLEPQFFAEFARLLPLDEKFARAQYDRSLWDGMRSEIATRIAEKTRDEWSALFEQTDACVAPVLSLSEAPAHAHARARHAHAGKDGFVRPMPAPRFSGMAGHISAPPTFGKSLGDFGISATEADMLRARGVIGSR
ncbi:MAG: CoA transferase [Rhizobiaceae bacterium]|nr:CoA transferase [Rhizobiaceae bacterium]